MKSIRRALLPALVSACFVNSASAAAPNTEAVEFYNVRLKHFFVTANAAEARGIDTGAAGPGWVRTGRSFQAWTQKSAAPADAKPVCRFYSSGANSHFYTADAAECGMLQSLRASELAAGKTGGWGYEGTAFYIRTPTAGACPAGSTALNRVYNNGFNNGEGSNHRFIDNPSLFKSMVGSGWIAEGTAMCAQAKVATGGNANLPPTTTSFEGIAATWQGAARWKVEKNDVETKVFEPLSLTIGLDGAVSGGGFGCTFTGTILEGDGFRSHFEGTISASGCTDPSFNGTFDSLDLERFDGNLLLARMEREDATVEVHIDALLQTDATLPPPPVDGGFAAVEGSWIGTVAWNAEQEGDDDDDDDDDGDDGDDDDGDDDDGDDDGENDEQTSVNQQLALQISADGAVTGSGFGCTFTGTLVAEGDDEGEFKGTLEASGCTEPAFNGTYVKVEVELQADGSLEIEIKRESSNSEVEIEGRLMRAP